MANGQVQDVLLVGLGAVGALYAAIQEHGMDLESYKYGSIKGWRPHRLIQSVAEAADRPYSYVFLVTKVVPDRTPNSKILAPFLAPDYAEKYPQPAYVLLQNGLNGEKDLYHAIKALGKEEPKIISAAVYLFITQMTPNVFVHDSFEEVVLGAYRFNDFTTTTNTPAETAILDGATNILVKGGSNTRHVPEVQRTKFLKNLRNVAFSSVTTLTRYTGPAIFRPPPPPSGPSYSPYVAPATAEAIHKYTITAMRATLGECIVLARALGYPDSEDGVPSSCVDDIMDSIRESYVQPTSTHKPSMMVDMEKDQPMEVEVLFGEVVRMAKERGVSVPRVEMLYALLLVVQNQIFRKLDEKSQKSLGAGAS